ncbi:hypothetical protein HHK36_020972 [Tetracentron sinense]|uniref:TTF-type domain-containing protein n=1 Tax=Tetracentron sinense TaxID=13715 RepID=A0A834YWC1_TETSI|nr:hypothetical protein HHK36_020972 [Tetracentron sinense]
MNSLKRDPGLRLPIWDYPIDQCDDISRAYIKVEPYQQILTNYPFSGPEKHYHQFQSSWFKLFPSWLEYSSSKDAAFCLSCYLFTKEANWTPWINHVGKNPNLPHNIAEQACKDLMSEAQHIEKIIKKQTSKQIVKNRLRLKTSIDSIRWLAFQACAFRGHDERPKSKNRGNFLEMIKILASYNKSVDEVVLENAIGNVKYTLPMIQKEILHILSRKVRDVIREEIGDAKFCIIVDEARNDSKRKQMTLVLRFVIKMVFYVKDFLTLFTSQILWR